MTNDRKPPESLSHLANKIEIVRTHRQQLQAATLTPIVWFFVAANLMTVAGIFGLAFLEYGWPQATPVITSGVIMSLIAGLTVEVSAIILAAFRGLFSDPGEQDPPNGGSASSEEVG